MDAPPDLAAHLDPLDVMSLLGNSAPTFTLASTKNMDRLDEPVSLEDHRGRWAVLIFYPADFTFVCPTEILAFSAAAEEFSQAGADLIGISTDSVHCHQAWIEFVLGPLTFPLAADVTHSVARDYGVLLEEGIAQRALFIVDPEGVVRYEVIHDDKVGRSVGEALRVLRALSLDVHVPADWEPGQINTLAVAA
jgi:peroxiredoxin (alkyl hydroperoxide reductase subunit C)